MRRFVPDSRSLVLACSVLAQACVTSYAAAPPLEFEDVRYESTDQRPWPLKEISLPKLAVRHGLGKEPGLSYVELGPEGGASKGTVVLIHGLGSSLKFWRYQLDALAARGYRVLAADMLGYGKSEKPAGFPYTTEAMAEVLEEWLEAAGAPDPILVGHSMGGQIALSYAISRPEGARALVLTAPAGFEYFSRREVAWFKANFSKALVKGATEEGIWDSVRKNNFNRWRPELTWLIEDRVRLAKARDFDAYAYAQVKSVHGLANDGFVRDNLEAIRVPVLIVHGDADRLIPNPFLHGGETRDIMEYGHQKIRGSRLVTLEACGHMVQMDCVDEYNREVVAFIESLGAPAEPPDETATN